MPSHAVNSQNNSYKEGKKDNRKDETKTKAGKTDDNKDETKKKGHKFIVRRRKGKVQKNVTAQVKGYVNERGEEEEVSCFKAGAGGHDDLIATARHL
eukprot:5482593-Ditylum_brightwellii.AAC.1